MLGRHPTLSTPHYNDHAYTRLLFGSPQLWKAEAQEVEERDINERRILRATIIAEEHIW